MPKVSIIIPVYNTEKYLHKCFASVYAQTLTDWEIVAVNDGSTDGSLSILNEYAAKDSRIRVIDQTNSGPGGARNTGIDNATGEYIAFLDSDDYVLPNAYQMLFEMAASQGLDIIQSELRSVNGEGQLLGHSDYVSDSAIDEDAVYSGRDVLLHNWFFTTDQTFFVRRDFLNEHNLRFIPGIYHEDTELIPKWVYYAQRMRCIRDVLYHRCLRDGSVITSRNIKKCYNLITVGDSLTAFADSVQDDDVNVFMHRFACMCYAACIQYAAKAGIPIRGIFTERGSRKSYCDKLGASPALKHRLMAWFIRLHWDRMFCAIYKIFADK
ncbi:MAG: glycosyltransferase [Spirochaetales bacterium]|nr:glycosyltransferase [Spirochaetales bacterium]